MANKTQPSDAARASAILVGSYANEDIQEVVDIVKRLAQEVERLKDENERLKKRPPLQGGA